MLNYILSINIRHIMDILCWCNVQEKRKRTEKSFKEITVKHVKSEERDGHRD